MTALLCSTIFRKHLKVLLSFTVAPLLIAGCSDTPPSWDRLITGKITSQYPAYTVTQAGDGVLLVARPGLEAKRIDAKAIGEFCRRGPRDCDYAVDQALLELQPPKP